MSHAGRLPALLPWVQVARDVAPPWVQSGGGRRAPLLKEGVEEVAAAIEPRPSEGRSGRVRIPPIDPSEERYPESSVGTVGQPETEQHSSGFEPFRAPSRAGLPKMSEATLIRAHRLCTCSPQSAERHTLAEWDAIEARQRAFAADPVAVEAETRDIERARGAV